MACKVKFSDSAQIEKGSHGEEIQEEIEERMRTLAINPIPGQSGVISFDHGQYGTCCNIEIIYEFDNDGTQLIVAFIA